MGEKKYYLVTKHAGHNMYLRMKKEGGSLWHPVREGAIAYFPLTVVLQALADEAQHLADASIHAPEIINHEEICQHGNEGLFYIGIEEAV